MSKRTVFTTITPLPGSISRETVVEFLHNHLEMIDLNPLVKERHPIKPPAHASPEEYHCVWYQLTDKVAYLPGGLASSDVAYTCAFHDLPTGLQTHCYAPLGLDIRDKWTLGGTLPGEPSQPVELGLGVPLTGLYIREDVDMRCNILATAFVKKTLKKAHAALVERLKVKAQIATAAERNAALEQQRREQALQQQLQQEARNNPLPPLPPSSPPPPFDGRQSPYQQYSQPGKPYPSQLLAQTTGGSTASGTTRQGSIRDAQGRVTWQTLQQQQQQYPPPQSQTPQPQWQQRPGAIANDPNNVSRWSVSTAATSLSHGGAPGDKQHASWAEQQRTSIYSGDHQKYSEEVPIRYAASTPPPPQPQSQGQPGPGKVPMSGTLGGPFIAELE